MDNQILQGQASTSQITLADFIGVTNSNGAFKTFTDITHQGFIDNLVNSEIFGIPGIPTPLEVVGTNIIFENSAFNKVSYLDDSLTTNKQKPQLDKAVMLLTTEYELTLEWSKLDKKSAMNWSQVVGVVYGNAWKSIRDQINLISMDAYVNYALASGQYKILENLDNKTATPEEIFADGVKLWNIADNIVSVRTKYNLGEDVSRVRFLTSFTANRQLNVGFSGKYSGANLAYEAIKGNSLGQFGGYSLQRSMYLGQNILKGSVTSDTKNYNFEDVPAIVMSIDSLGYYWQMFNENPEIASNNVTLFADMFNQFAINISKTKFITSIIFRANAIIKPARREINYVIFNSARTLAQVNNARVQLAQEQPSTYVDFATQLTQADVDAYNAAAILF